MFRQKRSSSLEYGQATVELLLILFVFVVLVFGAFGLGQGIALKHALDAATEKAARLLSIDPTDFGAADALIRAEVSASVLGGGYGPLVSVGLYDADTLAPITPDDVAAAPFSYRFIVQATVPFAADAPFLNLTGRTITAAHYGIVDRVLP